MKTLIYLTSSSYGSLAIKEALDMALVFGTFEQDVSIAVTGSALSLLIENQSPTAEHGKHLYKLLDGLEFYEIENIFVRGDEANELTLWDGITSLTEQQWQKLFTEHQQVLRF